MGVSPTGRSGGGGGITGGGDLNLLPLEHSHTVHWYQAHYGPVSGVVSASGFKGGQAVVVTERIGLGQDVDGGSGGGTDGGGGGYGPYSERDGINRWEDTVANVILRKDPNAPLDSALVLEIQHPNMKILGRYGGRLNRER